MLMLFLENGVGRSVARNIDLHGREVQHAEAKSAIGLSLYSELKAI